MSEFTHQAHEGLPMGRIAAAVGVASAMLLSSCGGEADDIYTAQEMVEVASDRFETHYSEQPPFDKLRLLYMTGYETHVDGIREQRSWNADIHDDLEADFGQNCLAGTSYDTTPSELRITGRSRGGGDVSAVATPELTEGGDIIVHPADGSENTPSLTFERDEASGAYLPGDDQTVRQLEGSGCDAEYNPLVDGPFSAFTVVRKDGATVDQIV